MLQKIYILVFISLFGILFGNTLQAQENEETQRKTFLKGMVNLGFGFSGMHYFDSASNKTEPGYTLHLSSPVKINEQFFLGPTVNFSYGFTSSSIGLGLVGLKSVTFINEGLEGLYLTLSGGIAAVKMRNSKDDEFGKTRFGGQIGSGYFWSFEEDKAGISVEGEIYYAQSLEQSDNRKMNIVAFSINFTIFGFWGIYLK